MRPGAWLEIARGGLWEGRAGHTQTVPLRLYFPIMPSTMFRLAFIDAAGCCTGARSAGAWKARVLEVRANIYAAIRFGGVEAVGGPLEGHLPLNLVGGKG